MADVINPAGWPRPDGYADAMSARGRVVALSGQIGWNPVTGEFETDDFVGQVAQALRNVRTVLEAAGCTTLDLVRVTWYITDRDAYMDSQREIGQAWRAVFGKHFPAMSVVVVAGLLEDRALVEIEATAVAPG